MCGVQKEMEVKCREASAWTDIDFEDLLQSREWMSVPERRLLFAILERAVRDALGNHPAEAREAAEWIFSPPVDQPELFSFQWICEELEVDIPRFLANVERMLQKKTLLPEAREHVRVIEPALPASQPRLDRMVAVCPVPKKKQPAAVLNAFAMKQGGLAIPANQDMN